VCDTDCCRRRAMPPIGSELPCAKFNVDARDNIVTMLFEHGDAQVGTVVLTAVHMLVEDMVARGTVTYCSLDGDRLRFTISSSVTRDTRRTLYKLFPIHMRMTNAINSVLHTVCTGTSHTGRSVGDVFSYASFTVTGVSTDNGGSMTAGDVKRICDDLHSR